MYSFYFNFEGEIMQLPVAPQELTLKVNDKNKVVELLNLGDVNILKNPGLTDIDFKILLPGQKLPFALYPNGFKMPEFYLGRLEKYKVKKKPVRFIVSRVAPWGEPLFDTNMLVAITEYTIEEKAGEEGDVYVQLQLKQYREYSTQTIKIKKVTKKKAAVKTKKSRSSSRKTPKTHKVVRGDTLWGIARKYLGKGIRWRDIYNLNRSKIRNPHWIYPGQVFKLPPR